MHASEQEETKYPSVVSAPTPTPSVTISALEALCSITWPEPFSLENSKIKIHILVTPTSSFFDILSQLIDATYQFYVNPQKNDIKNDLKELWDHNASSFHNRKSLSALTSFLSKIESKRKLLSVIIKARTYLIQHHQTIGCKTIEEQLHYFKATQQRFHFMSCIANMLEQSLYTVSLKTERHHFLMGMCNDIMTNAHNVSSSLLLVSYRSSPFYLNMLALCQIIFEARGQFFEKIQSTLQLQPSLHDTELVADILIHKLPCPLDCARYFYAIKEKVTALACLNQAKNIAPFTGSTEKKALFQAQSKDLLANIAILIHTIEIPLISQSQTALLEKQRSALTQLQQEKTDLEKQHTQYLHDSEQMLQSLKATLAHVQQSQTTLQQKIEHNEKTVKNNQEKIQKIQQQLHDMRQTNATTAAEIQATGESIACLQEEIHVLETDNPAVCHLVSQKIQSKKMRPKSQAHYDKLIKDLQAKLEILKKEMEEPTDSMPAPDATVAFSTPLHTKLQSLETTHEELSDTCEHFKSSFNSALTQAFVRNAEAQAYFTQCVHDIEKWQNIIRTKNRTC